MKDITLMTLFFCGLLLILIGLFQINVFLFFGVLFLLFARIGAES